jgi:putative peptidoglycan lipid II flippase
VAGAIVGPFLASVLGAVRIGTGYRPSFDIGNPAFREWVRLSIPLMLGVSLVTADDWILRHYAASGVGDIARLNYAKRLFAVPIAVLGQATGQASLPFFARLFNEKRLKEFATTVNDSVYRVAAASFLATGWMMAAAFPLIDLVYRRGRFLVSDTQTTAIYFFWFSLSLALWSAQGLYARAFYAAGDTLTPMAAVTIITSASLRYIRCSFTATAWSDWRRLPTLVSERIYWRWPGCCTIEKWFRLERCDGMNWQSRRSRRLWPEE